MAEERGQQQPRQPPRNIKGAPDYDCAQYWDAKFINERRVGEEARDGMPLAGREGHVEWLGSGQELATRMIAHLRKRDDLHVLPSHRQNDNRLLHIGPGTSDLIDCLAAEFEKNAWPTDGIVNVDFSLEAVIRGRERHPTSDSRWFQADLRDWSSIERDLLPLVKANGTFDAIIDKSTSDSISTSDFCASSCPLLTEAEKDHRRNRKLDPMDLLSLHLAALTQPGAKWFVLSYSSSRFHDLETVQLHEKGFRGAQTSVLSCSSHTCPHWTVLECVPIEAPYEGPSAPVVFHWLYTLERV